MAELDVDEINDILVKIGVPGRYQLIALASTFILSTFTQAHTLILPFTQADVNFRCNQTDFPVDTSNFSSLYDEDIPSCFTNSSVEECTDFVYEDGVFTNTIINQDFGLSVICLGFLICSSLVGFFLLAFDLVCSRVALSTVANMIYMGMGIPGGVICGIITDRFGRKTAIIGFLILTAVSGLISAFSVNFTMYIIMRCIVSVPGVGLWDATNAHMGEITAPNKRPHVLVGVILAWCSSLWLSTFISYFLRDWSHLTIAISVPCFLMIPAAFWIYDESPHWLYSQKRYTEAQRVIDKIVRWNGLPYDDSYVIKPASNETENDSPDEKMSDDFTTVSDKSTGEEKSEGLLDVFKSPPYLKIVFICTFGWLACNLGYYGLFVGIDELGGDIFVNSVIGGGVEAVAYLSTFLMMATGRKKLYVTLQIIGGCALLASGFVAAYLADVTWAIITLTMVGRLCLSAAWQVLYVWCVELFPTTIRVTMLQVTLISGHIGSMIGPLTADLPKIIKNTSIKTVMIGPCLYGALLLVTGGLSLYLPETNNKPLPVTIEEAKIIFNMERPYKRRTKRGEIGPQDEDQPDTKDITRI